MTDFLLLGEDQQHWWELFKYGSCTLRRRRHQQQPEVRISPRRSLLGLKSYFIIQEIINACKQAQYTKEKAR